MPVKVKGLKALNARLARLTNTVEGDARSMNKVAAKASLLVIDRTRKGRDSTGIKGRSFKRYTKGYLETRKKKGRKGRVDLTDTGNMLSSITHSANKRRAKIFFRKANENLKAHGLHFGSSKNGLPPRPFFGLTRNEGRKILRMIAENIGKVIK